MKNLARKEGVQYYPRGPFYLSDLIITAEIIQPRRIKRDMVLFWFAAFKDNFMKYARVLRLLIHELLCPEAIDYPASKASSLRWGLSTPHQIQLRLPSTVYLHTAVKSLVKS